MLRVINCSPYSNACGGSAGGRGAFHARGHEVLHLAAALSLQDQLVCDSGLVCEAAFCIRDKNAISKLWLPCMSILAASCKLHMQAGIERAVCTKGMGQSCYSHQEVVQALP